MAPGLSHTCGRDGCSQPCFSILTPPLEWKECQTGDFRAYFVQPTISNAQSSAELGTLFKGILEEVAAKNLVFSTFPNPKDMEGDSLYFNYECLFPMGKWRNVVVFLVSTDLCPDGFHCAVCAPFENPNSSDARSRYLGAFGVHPPGYFTIFAEEKCFFFCVMVQKALHQAKSRTTLQRPEGAGGAVSTFGIVRGSDGQKHGQQCHPNQNH
eukprot:c19028_g1_i3.p1 GENE.c19028_g1_i3~~c19028_g1_i3.p1  ORF type:complete len:211 (-),score=28.92 c19028_g1_i3:314-946(-)